VIDGHHRLRVCHELGIDPKTERATAEQERLGLVLNMARRQLPRKLRNGMVEALLRADPGRSNNSIALEVGVSHPVVGRARKALEQRGQLERCSSRRGRDGRLRRVPAAKKSAAEAPVAAEREPLWPLVYEPGTTEMVMVEVPKRFLRGGGLLGGGFRFVPVEGGYRLELLRRRRSSQPAG
jgi:ParB-like chromosome segregation protein Spo0J